MVNGAIFSGRGNSGALGPILVPSAKGGIAPLLDIASLCTLERRLEQAGGDPDGLWGTSATWSIPSDVLDDWLSEAADGLAHAIVSACSIIDFECVKIDGRLPVEVRARLVQMVRASLDRLSMTGLDRPEILRGTVGPDARSLGAASLPLSRRFLLEVLG